ncbi:MAG: MotA/TolQ/ExbB proton channel family protein [Deltaproteobacteria bacterium]|nr:MAG: MotA/TolQ/ExbB proton channel family protein [Deltaproteobacteria bacterium]
MGFLEQFNPFSRSGIWMFLILMVSVYIVTIVVERAYVLWFRFKIDANQILSRIISFVDSNNYSRAIEVCNARQNHPLCVVLKSGLLKANRSDVEIRRAMEQATLKVSPEIQKRVPYLATLANVATLLGLLGTIFGLIMAFEGVEMASAAKKQEVLARGISLAMNTTAFGLIVAIPTTIAHAVLSSRQNALLDLIEDSALTLFNHLSAKNRVGTMKH